MAITATVNATILTAKYFYDLTQSYRIFCWINWALFSKGNLNYTKHKAWPHKLSADQFGISVINLQYHLWDKSRPGKAEIQAHKLGAYLQSD